jgi:2-oxoglutarate ferredoxin oxidoreductase subunit beta
MNGLAAVIEEAIRYPGFAFVNVQSPCVTFGEESQQVKAQRTMMKPVASLGHDATNRIHAMELAQEYGRTLYTGVLYRDPRPSPTLDAQVRERQKALGGEALPRERILEAFVQK